MPFQLDNDWRLSATRPLDADRDENFYYFDVIATDVCRIHGMKSKNTTATVAVYVRNINDTPPKFSQSIYIHTAYAGFPIGTVVAAPFAYDDVDPVHSEYTYSMYGWRSGLWYMDPNDGTIRTSERLSYIRDRLMLEYTITAVDTNDATLRAEAVLVMDVIPMAGRRSNVTRIEEKTPKPEPTCCCKVPC